MPAHPPSCGGDPTAAHPMAPGGPVHWTDAAPAPGCRAAQHRRRGPRRQRRAGARGPGGRRGGGGRPLRRPRARHPGLPARGPAPQTRFRGRQRGRAGEGGCGHGPVRRRRGLRRRRRGRYRFGQCGGRVRRRPGGRCLPQALPPQLRRLRRAALVRPQPRAAGPVRGRRRLGGCLHLRGRLVRRRPGGPGRPRRRRRRREPQRVALQPGAAGRTAGHARAAAWPRPDAPSPT